MPLSPYTAKGHLNQERKNLQMTKMPSQDTTTTKNKIQTTIKNILQRSNLQNSKILSPDVSDTKILSPDEIYFNIQTSKTPSLHENAIYQDFFPGSETPNKRANFFIASIKIFINVKIFKIQKHYPWTFQI